MSFMETLKKKKTIIIAVVVAIAVIIAAVAYLINATKPYALTESGEKINKAYSLTIDGKEVGLFESKDKCAKVVDGIKNYYVEDESNVTSVEIKQDIAVEEAKLERGFTAEHPVCDNHDEVLDFIMTGTEEKKTYTVRNGDTAWDIAGANDVSIKKLSSWNDDVNLEKLTAGDEINLYEEKSLVDVTTVEKVTYTKQIKFKTKYIKTSKLTEGQTKVKKAGKYGKKRVKATVTKENGKTVDTDITVSKVIKKPVTQVVYKGTATAGQTVVNFAMQFVGNPYVWGGTSLTNGCDCSGFTMAVYAHFGYGLPHNSWAQMGSGREVSYSEAKPGDLIIYGNHVALYAGGGMIVHAANPRQGITTGYATYRPILSVRRILN